MDGSKAEKMLLKIQRSYYNKTATGRLKNWRRKSSIHETDSIFQSAFNGYSHTLITTIYFINQENTKGG